MKRFVSEQKILLIVLAGFILRFVGIWYGLPNMYNSDEPFNVVNALAYGSKHSLEPTYFVYPALYSYILLASYGAYFLFGRLTGLFGNAMEFGISYFLNPSGFFWVGRSLSVLLGLGTIWLIYIIGNKFFSNKVGTLSAGLLAVSAIHVDLSHWVLPETALTFFCTLAIYFLLKYNSEPDWRHLLWSGLTIGLAISTKYNAGFLILPLLLTVYFAAKENTLQTLTSVAGGLAAVAAGFLVGSPYWLLAPQKYIDALKYTFAHVDAGMVGHLSSMPLIWPLWGLLSKDLTVGLLLVAGVFYGVLGPKRNQVILLIFVVPTLLCLGMWSRTGVHYLAPVLPALVLLAAVLAERLLSLLPGRTIAVAGVILLLLPVVISDLYMDIRLCQPDSRTAARAWIEKHIPDRSMVAYENYVYGPNLFDPGRFIGSGEEGALLPIAIKEELVAESFRRASYRLVNLRKHFKPIPSALDKTIQQDADNSYERQLRETELPALTAIRRAGVPYLIASSANYDRYFRGSAPMKGTALWHSYQNGRAFYRAVASGDELELMQEFRAGRWNLGPTIRVYRFIPRKTARPNG